MPLCQIRVKKTMNYYKIVINTKNRRMVSHPTAGLFTTQKLMLFWLLAFNSYIAFLFNSVIHFICWYLNMKNT